ncbi:MAG TPA: FAD-dependent oxidoreductase [Chthoniobacterales bacterium]|nr:FAD-dependent oxidoreductase [Chthoniobacterales bacterium]
MRTTRRKFIGTVGASAAAMLVGCKKARKFSGAIVGASSSVGHRLRTGNFPSITETIETSIVIVGGGIAGLAAARRLDQRGRRDFLLIELEHQPGGNAVSGQNAVSAYPWGAHYVPLPNDEATEVLALFEELGVTRGHDANGAPIYHEEFLCADPMERLLDAGRWQEGLVPQIGITADDRRQYEDFFARMESLRSMRGRDGRPAFAIPLDLSSRDAELLALDGKTMAAWMTEHGWNSVPLRWHVDYSCRDDYGAGIAQVSAWAGVHYFASRRGRAANADRDAVVTWPEGNGWLVKKLATPCAPRTRSGGVVYNIEQSDGAVVVDYLDVERDHSVRVKTHGVVCAAPRFVARRMIRDLPVAKDAVYSPWMVANITLDQLPDGSGAPLAWDNVARASDSLGYVVATHQNVDPVPQETVITHYWPLDGAAPAEERQRALARTHADWCERVVADLDRTHPGIHSHIRNIDVWVWGHGMIRPVPGFIWGEARQQMQRAHGRIVFAHSDMSGISIFEEAFTRGTQAADALLALTG